MVALAARKARGANVFVADVRSLGSVGRFDLVTCLDDSLNYLQSEGDLAAALPSLRSNLASDGVCVFDMNTIHAYRTTFASNQAREEAGVLFLWRGESDASADHAAWPPPRSTRSPAPTAPGSTTGSPAGTYSGTSRGRSWSD
jgi:hypothetical protein